jgi:hypothetical protein
LHIAACRLTFCLLLLATCLHAQQPETAGKFVLHKFAKAIGQETYTSQSSGETTTLTSHFLFKDRGSAVPLETVYVSRAADGSPVSYTAKGKSSRLSEMDDSLTVNGNSVSITQRQSPDTNPLRRVVHH